MTYNIFLTEQKLFPWLPGDIIVHRSDGRDDKYIRNADGSYTPPAGINDTLVKNGDNTFTLTLAVRQTKQNFYAIDASSTAGKIRTQVDVNSNRATFSYNASGLLTTLTEPSARVTTFSYTSSRLTQVETPGATSQYSYDANTNLQTSTDPLGYVTTFGYNAQSRIISGTPYVIPPARDPRLCLIRPAIRGPKRVGVPETHPAPGRSG